MELWLHISRWVCACMNCYNAVVVTSRSIFKGHATEWGEGTMTVFPCPKALPLLANIIYEREMPEENPSVLHVLNLDTLLKLRWTAKTISWWIEESACIRKIASISMSFIVANLSWMPEMILYCLHVVTVNLSSNVVLCGRFPLFSRG